jgi:signal transduction histidine kinase
MSASLSARPRGLALLFGWRRVRFTLLFSFAIGALIGLGWASGWWSAVIRVVALGMVAMLVFGVFEQWPRRLPRWLARWALQVVAVAVSMPVATFVIYVLSTQPGAPPFWMDSERLQGFGGLAGFGTFLSPWIALGALVRQKDALARHQALEFDLERSEYQRNAVEARLRLLQAQVEPHFLFNTLANVRELVDARSPQASAVLGSLIAYLRAAVPRLHEPTTTLRQELDLVRAYLDVMHMRIPDRLQFTIHAEPDTLSLQCPPMTLLTLVENAVRHGIDPSEEGGRIEVRARMRDRRCRVEVIDTGVGLAQPGDGGLGTGLANLRERMALAFAGDAVLQLQPLQPHGTCAQLEFPARSAA